MRFVWDTNVLVHRLKNSLTYESLEAQFGFFSDQNEVFISIVTVAEIFSLASQRQWKGERLLQLNLLISKLKPIPIDRKVLVDFYIQLDVYSQGKDPLMPLPPGMSSRNMGKNDLWIAATAMAIEAALITFDQDFDHLRNIGLVVHRTNE